MAKISFLFPLTTLLLIVLLFLSPPTTKAADDTLVVDTDGNPLEASVPYHITSLAFNRGFIYYPIRMGKICPLLNVALASAKNDLGNYQTFSPKNSTENQISVKQELQIFGEPVPLRPPMFCRQPTGWRLRYDRPTATSVVSLGGKRESSDLFRMVAVKIGRKVAYKIVIACPKAVPFSSDCGHLGYVSENGRKFLAMTRLPQLFVFKKAAPNGGLDQYY